MRPGMLSASGPATIAGNSVRTSISRVMRPLGRRRSVPPSAFASREVRRGARGRSSPVGRTLGGWRSSASASMTISPRRGAKIRMNARTAGRSNVPNGPSRHDEDLVLGHAIDVLDDAQVGAVEAGHVAADDLVPVDLPAAQIGRGPDLRLEVGLAQGVRALPRGDLAEAHTPARSVLDGLGRGDGQRPVRAFAEQHGARHEPALGPIGQDLHANGAVQARGRPARGRPRAAGSPISRSWPSSATGCASLRRSRAGRLRHRGPR